MVRPKGLGSGVTRFGASDVSSREAVRVLQARAVRHGLVLAPASDVDVAAAVVAAELWLVLTQDSGFEHVVRHGEDAVRVLAAVLARAAGSAPELDEASLRAVCELSDLDPELLRAVEASLLWVAAHLPAQVVDVASRAAADLAAGGLGSRCAAAAGVLLMVADAP